MISVAVAVLKQAIQRASEYLMAGDYWAHWHYGASSPNAAGLYYTNILFFDGHVKGKLYPSGRAGLAYLNWDGIRRWWVSTSGPFVYPE